MKTKIFNIIILLIGIIYVGYVVFYSFNGKEISNNDLASIIFWAVVYLRNFNNVNITIK